MTQLRLVIWVAALLAAQAAAASAAAEQQSNCTNQPKGSQTVARINCGGPAIEYPQGHLTADYAAKPYSITSLQLPTYRRGPALEYPQGCYWTADDAANPYPNKTSGADRLEAASTDQCNPRTNPGGPLACTMRWSGVPINYTFPAEYGRSYEVIVHMSEVYFNTSGNRSINILVNGIKQYTNIDPFAAAGGRFLSTLYKSTLKFEPNVTLGVPTGGFNITVGMTASKDYPCVSAIEVYDVTDVPQAGVPMSAVIGGVVGGVGGALLLTAIGTLLYRRRKRAQMAEKPITKDAHDGIPTQIITH